MVDRRTRVKKQKVGSHLVVDMRTRQQKKAGSHMLADRRTRVDIKKSIEQPGG